MIEIAEIEQLINDNKKMINMFETFKNKIVLQNEILSRVLDDYQSNNLAIDSNEKVSSPKKEKKTKNSSSKDENIEEESNVEEPVKSKKDKKKDKIKKITKANTKVLETIKNKLENEGKNNIEVELIKVDKKSYYVAEDGIVYNKKAEIIGKYNFDEETIILE